MEASNRLIRSTSDKMQSMRRRISDKFSKSPAGKDDNIVKSNSEFHPAPAQMLVGVNQDRMQKTLDAWLISPSEHGSLSPTTTRSSTSTVATTFNRCSSDQTSSTTGTTFHRRRSDQTSSATSTPNNRRSNQTTSTTATTNNSNSKNRHSNSKTTASACSSDLSSSSSSYSVFPKPVTLVPAPKSIPYQQLLHQCRVLRHEWLTSLSSLVMIAEMGATGLEILMARAISSGGTITYELNGLVHSFRVVHTAVPRPTTQHTRVELPAPLTAAGAYSLAECCAAWAGVVAALDDGFEKWLAVSPEAAVDGAKGCLSRLMAIRSAVVRTAPRTEEGPGRRGAEHDAEILLQKGVVADLKAKVESAGAEFLRNIRSGELPGDPQVFTT